MTASSVTHQAGLAGETEELHVPRAAEGLQLLGEMQGSGYRRPPALVRRADGQTVTLTPLLYVILRAMDGRRPLAEIAQLASAAVNRHVTTEDIGYLVERKLRPLGLVVGRDGAQPTTRKANPLLALKLKVVLSNPRVTRRITAPFAWLFRPSIVLPAVLAFAFLSWWVLVDKGLASAVHHAMYEPTFILAVWGVVVVSAAFHEFGHAAACRYGGATPGVMGAGLYLVWPAFYTEVTDSYRLGRGGRLRVDLGGLYFNALFALATWVAWWFLRWDALLLVIVAQHLQMVRQLAPFIRADGYHIIADITGVPDLFAHIKPTLLSVLPRRWRPGPPPALKPWARAVVILWVLTMVPILVSVLVLGVLMLPRLVATAWDSMGVQWGAASAAWVTGDMAEFLHRSMASVLVTLPVLALVYLLVRVGRRTARAAWRSSENSPRKRIAFLLLAAAAIAVVAWAWWPQGQYRPIQGDEDGNLADIVRVEDRRIFVPMVQDRLRAAPAPAVAAGVEGAPAVPETRRLVVVQRGPGPWASETYTQTQSLPGSAASPTGTVPTNGDASSAGVAWPFPFNPPAEVSEGDNRAMAVNTTDGSVATDLAVSWALVTAGELTQNNEAWALASCTDCATRVVAFQVLLMTPDLQVVTPENIAVAVNYNCTRCVTEALAQQLVLTVTNLPSDEAKALIDDAMQDVATLETDLADISLEQMYWVLRATEDEIVRILQEDGAIPAADLQEAIEVATEEATGASADTATADTSTSADATPGTSDTSASAEPSESATASTDEQVTTDTTSEPAPTTSVSEEPSSEPTPTATADPTPTSEPSPTAEPSPSPSDGTTTDVSVEPSPSG